MTHPSKFMRTRSIKRLRPEPDSEDSNKTPDESSPPKRPRVDAISRRPKLSRRLKVRFGPDTVDNEPWQDLFEAKYMSERPPTPFRTPDSNLSLDSEIKKSSKLSGTARKRPNPVESTMKLGEEPAVKDRNEDTKPNIFSRPTSILSFHDIVLPHLNKNVTKEEHEEANNVFSRIRAKLSTEDDELLRDALGKLCKVECGKVWLLCRNQALSKA